MQEKLRKIFLSKELSLNSIKIKIYINLVFNILSLLYYNLFIPDDFNKNFNQIEIMQIIIYYVVFCLVPFILMILALYNLSKLSHTPLLGKYIFFTIFLYVFMFSLTYVYVREYSVGYIVAFVLALFTLGFAFLYFDKLFRISGEKLFLYCFYLWILAVVAMFIYFCSSFFPSLQTRIEYIYLSSYVYDIFYFSLNFLELIAWIRFKSLKK